MEATGFNELLNLARGVGKPPAYKYVGNGDSQAQADILTWCGGELFLLARKD